MGTSQSKINILFKGQTLQLKKSLDEVKKKVGGFGKSFATSLKSFAIGFVGVSAAIGGIIGGIKKTIQVNREFEKSFTNVLTLLDTADKAQFGDMLRQGSIDLMRDFGFSIEDVNKALFDTISAGIPASEAINFLKDSSKLAIGGVTDLSTAVDGMTTIMNAFGIEMTDVGRVSSAFFTAQKYGKTTVELLSNAVGSVAPIAKQAGISFQEMLSVMAELTKQGIYTDESATALKATITALLKPGKEAQAVFDKLGISYGATRIKQEGFLNVFKQIIKASETDNDVLVKLIPNIRALVGAGALTSEAFGDLDAILEKVNTDFGDNSSLTEAANEQMETAEFLAKQLGGAWRKLILTSEDGETKFNKLYKNLLKGLISLVDGALSLSEKFKSFWNENTKAAKVFRAAVQAMSSGIKLAFKSIKTTIYTALILPFKTVGKLVMAVINGEFSQIGGILKDAFKSAKTEILDFGKTAIQEGKKIGGAYEGIPGKIVEDIKKDAIPAAVKLGEDLGDAIVIGMAKRKPDKLAGLEAHKPKFDIDHISLSDKVLEGLKEKVTGVQEQSYYLFETMANGFQGISDQTYLFGEGFSAVMGGIMAMNEQTWNAIGAKIMGTFEMSKERLRTFAELANSSFQVLGGIHSSMIRKQDVENDNYYYREKKRIIQNVTDEQEKSRQLEALDMEMERRKRKSAREAAKASKAYNLAGAIMNTALGVTKALELGPIAGPIAAAIISGLGLKQIQIIESTPLPAAAKGAMAFAPTLMQVGDNPAARVDPEVVAPLSKLKEYMGGQDINIRLSGKLRGQDIVLAAEKYKTKYSKVT